MCYFQGIWCCYCLDLDSQHAHSLCCSSPLRVCHFCEDITRLGGGKSRHTKKYSHTIIIIKIGVQRSREKAESLKWTWCSSSGNMKRALLILSSTAQCWCTLAPFEYWIKCSAEKQERVWLCSETHTLLYPKKKKELRSNSLSGFRFRIIVCTSPLSNVTAGTNDGISQSNILIFHYSLHTDLQTTHRLGSVNTVCSH